ncbi:phosphohistidine phosphatase SixA [soil metagenome]
MELILWRHAEAEPGEPDDGRLLTSKGHKQAVKVGAWLDHNLPTSCKILSSPTRRTVQTAEALGRRFKIVPALATETDPRKLLALTNWPDGREPVLVIGHQPALGCIASLLMTGVEQDWPMRKAGVWWFMRKDREGQAFTYLKAVMIPDLLIK